MNKSLFAQLVDKYFAPIVRKVTETINGRAEAEQLLHKTMLDEEYSPDLKWESTELEGAVVAAEVVSLDSKLPLKKRDALRTASGRIPKLGLKFRKDESDLTQLNIMLATGAAEDAIVRKLMNDVPRVVTGIEHRVEMMFQQALSTGQVLITGDETDGTGIRASFGYKEENIFHCTAGVWGTDTAKPIDDIQQLENKAQEDGRSLTGVMLSKASFEHLRKSADGKLLVANVNGIAVTDVTKLAKPTREQMLDALEAEFNVPFVIVNSAFKIEKPNGTRETIRPWEQANVVGITSDKVGRLVYGRLAEETNPVNGVDYEKSGSYILVSKYSKNEPLEEFTAGQAFVLPVIDGGNSVYVLHTDAEGAGNFKVGLTTVEFGKSADSQVVDVHYDGDGKITASSSVAWATVKVVRDKVTINVTENTGSSSRSGNITVTDGKSSATIAVTQTNKE